MEKYQWINPDNHSIAVDDQKQPVLNENGDLIVLDNESEYCLSKITSKCAFYDQVHILKFLYLRKLKKMYIEYFRRKVYSSS